MNMWKVIPAIIAVCLVLSACDDTSASASSSLGVGDKMPNGSVILDKKEFPSPETCISTAKEINSRSDVIKVDEMSQESMYSSQLRLKNGKTQGQVCISQANGSTIYYLFQW